MRLACDACCILRKAAQSVKLSPGLIKEILTLPDVIAKANKNFLVYCRVGVFKMLQSHVKCHRVDGLDAIMSSCNASILDETPNDKVKLSARIVKGWWFLCGLPYVTEVFHIEPEVRLVGALPYCSFL
jgi:hypothetical protein